MKEMPALNAQEIAWDDWTEALADFTRENRGAHGRLEVLKSDPDPGYLVETEDRPFEGVSADTKDGERTVWITFGSTAADHLAHSVPRAAAIRILEPSMARGAVLGVDSRDGTRTVLELSKAEDFALSDR